MEAIISAVISAIGAVVVCVINSNRQASTTRGLIDYKIGELAKRVEKHNNVIERVYKLEQDEAVIQEQIKVANHRILDLENASK